MNRQQLYERLGGRPDDPQQAEPFDAAIVEEIGQTVAVLITDLSGFTRLTQKHGILHFLAIFQRARQLAVPQFSAHGGRVVKMVADNMIAVFAEPMHALAAAKDMLRVIDEDNETHPEDSRVRICCGIGYGPVLLLDDDIFGDDLNVAFKLGEDVAEPSEILISEAAVSHMLGHGLGEDQLDGPRTEKQGGVELVHYAAR